MFTAARRGVLGFHEARSTGFLDRWDTTKWPKRERYMRVSQSACIGSDLEGLELASSWYSTYLGFRFGVGLFCQE